MKYSLSLISISLLVALSEAALVRFNVVAPGASDVKVLVNGQQVALTASIPNVPYFTGDAEVGAAKDYKYVAGGVEEPFARNLDSTKASTLNDFYNRRITYANIPKLPWPIEKEPQWTREGEKPSIFDENYIPTIFFTGDAKQIEDMVKNVPKETITGSLTVIAVNAVHTFDGVTFGLHGAGKKHNNAKQSWHWSFKPGDQLAKRTYFKLRHMEEDPTQIRERLYSDILHAMGTYANEANMVRLFINGEGYGTFNMLDDITQFSYINAMFYGGQEPAKQGLLYDGQSGASYAYHTNIYDGYTSWRPNPDNKEIGYESLNLLCKKLNETNTQDNAAVAAFESMFDTDRFLRFMVMEYLTGHWDGYWMGQTNNGVFKEGESNKWYALEQDFDGTFGINLAVVDIAKWMTTSYKQWPSMYPSAVMINRLLENKEKQATFEKYLTETVRVLFNNVTLTNRVLALHDFLLEDLYWDRSIKQRSPGINFGWTFEQATQNLWTGVGAPNLNGGGAAFGLVEWIIARSQAVANEFKISIVTQPVYPPNNSTLIPNGANRTITPTTPQPPTNAAIATASVSSDASIQIIPASITMLAVLAAVAAVY